MLFTLSLISVLAIGSTSSSPVPNFVATDNSTIDDSSNSTLQPKAFNIPLTKRQNLGSDMSPAERLSMLKNSAVRTCAKYGIAEIMGAGSISSSKRKRDLPKGIIQMGVAPSDTFYYGTIQVGTPPIAFEVSLDTGSSDLILAAPVCTEGCSNDTPLYRTSYSSTSFTQNIPFVINYQGGGASGFLASDVVSFAGFTNNDQTFGAITRSATIIGAGGVSGLLGLAWRPLAASGALPFVEGLWQAGLLPSPLFAFAFARYGAASSTVNPGGILTVGGVDGTFFSGAINYIASPSRAYWQIKLDNIVINGQALGTTAPNVNIDTGTTNIYVPLAVANAIYAKIPKSTVAGGGFYTYPCKSATSIGFEFGGIIYQISQSDLNIGYSDSSGLNCYGAISAIGSAPDGSDQYIFGDAFLKNVYSVFRFDPPSIGFAQLNNPAAISQGDVPVGNAEKIGQAGNNNNAPTLGASTFAAPAPAVVANPVPAAIVAGANGNPSTPSSSPATPPPPPAPLPQTIVAASSPSPAAAVQQQPAPIVVVKPLPIAAPSPAAVIISGSNDVGSLAAKLEDALTAYIADSTRNAILLITCLPPKTINKSQDLWTCSA